MPKRPKLAKFDLFKDETCVDSIYAWLFLNPSDRLSYAYEWCPGEEIYFFSDPLSGDDLSCVEIGIAETKKEAKKIIAKHYEREGYNILK
jgi:hypothetical protein